MPISRKILLLLLFLAGPVLANTGPVDRLLQQANTWESRDRLDLARKAIDKLFRVSPENPHGLARLAFYELREKNTLAAQETLQRLLKADAKHPDIANIKLMLRLSGPDKKYLQQAQLLAKAGRTAEAIKAYDSLFSGNMPTDQIAFEYWTLVSNTQNGWKRSEQGFYRLTQQYPESLRYRLALIEHRLIRSPGNKKLLAELFVFVQHPRYQRQAAATWRRAMFRLDETHSSIPYYQKYLEYDPKDTVISELLNKVQRSSKTTKKKLMSPAHIAKNKGLEHLENDQLAAAEKYFIEALRLNPADYDAIGGMGTIRLRQGQHVQARSYFDRALKRNPDNASKWQSLSETAQFWGLLAQADRQEEKGQLQQARLSIKQALVVKPQHPDALTALAKIHAQQGKKAKAASLYKRALKQDASNSNVLRNLISHHLDNDDHVKAKKIIRGLSTQQRRSLGNNYERLYARALRAESDQLQRNGKLKLATSQLELARRYQPDDPWLLYGLARLYNKQGNPDLAYQHFDQALLRNPNSDETLYAYALFLDSRDIDNKALDLLNRIPEKDRSLNIKTTHDRLQVKINRRLAREHKAHDREDEAFNVMYSLQQQMQHSPDRLIEVVHGWTDIGQAKQALSLLEQLTRDSRLSSDASIEIKRQRNRLLLDQAEQYRRLGKHQQALDILQGFQTDTAQQDDVLREKAALYRAMQKPAMAANYYQQLLQLHPQETDLIFDLLHAQIEARQIIKAQELAITINHKLEKKDVPHRLALIEAWSDMQNEDKASQLLAVLRNDFPENPEVLRLAARQAKNANQDDEALRLLKSARTAYQQQPTGSDLPELTSLNDDIDELSAKRTGEFNIAYDLTTRTQTDGQSTLTAELIPMELRFPSIHNGHVFLRIEPAKLDAGSLLTSDRGEISEFGQGLFCFPICNGASPNQKATGTSFAIGYENETLRLDIGTTPLGFLVEDIVGGVTLDGDLGTFSWGIDISRRPLTSTLMTFAGARDINTGKVWGGIRTNGVTFSLSHDEGGPVGFWSNLDLHHITGKNVASNNRVRLMGGMYWKFINNDSKQVSIGLNAGIWRHEKSLDEFTFGQGGYYSPNRYRSISLPFDFYGRYNDRLSYRFKASVSHSWTFENRTAYYPNDPALQAAAEAAQGTTGIDPHFEGGSGGGIGYSLKAGVEYKLNDHLAIGAEAGLERSDFYEPNHFIGYLHYTFEKDKRHVRTPPVPMIPYANF